MNLVQLLHPDLQRDPALKRVAEIQLRRVNRVYAVLSDPERRRRYDATLGSAAPPAAAPAAPRGVPRAITTLAWLACAVLGILGIGWYVSKYPAGSRSSVPAPERTQPAPPVKPAAEAAKPVTPPASFAGSWSLPDAAPTAAPPSGPELIELSIVEEHDTLRGRFHARYPAPSPPTTADIDLSFEGTRSGASVVLAGRGERDTSGELRFRLVAENSLEASWSVIATARPGPPVTGTALLTRRAPGAVPGSEPPRQPNPPGEVIAPPAGPPPAHPETR